VRLTKRHAYFGAAVSLHRGISLRWLSAITSTLSVRLDSNQTLRVAGNRLRLLVAKRSFIMDVAVVENRILQSWDVNGRKKFR
jgi:hypothetical protein